MKHYIVQLNERNGNDILTHNLGWFSSIEDAQSKIDELVGDWVENHTTSTTWDAVIVETIILNRFRKTDTKLVIPLCFAVDPNADTKKYILDRINETMDDVKKSIPPCYQMMFGSPYMEVPNNALVEVANDCNYPTPAEDDITKTNHNPMEESRKVLISNLLKSFPLFDGIGTKFYNMILDLPIYNKEDLLDLIAESFNPESTKLDPELKKCIIELFGHWFARSEKK